MFKANYYWIFNVKLLQDVYFCGEKKKKKKYNVLEYMEIEEKNIRNLSQWWDVGKANIKMFCQNYAFHSSGMLKATVKALQTDIESLEKQIVNNNEAVQCGGLNKKRQELNFLLHEQAKGALIRTRYCSIKDMDAPSTSFFNLERKHVYQKMMCHLHRADGSVT